MPDWSQEIRRRLAPLKLDAAREAAFVEEFSADLEDRYAALLAKGLPAAAACQQTLKELGEDGLLARELTRAGRKTISSPIAPAHFGSSMITDFLQDVRYGSRMLWKQKGVTTVALLSLALGIGVNAAIFSLIDAVLLRTLQVERPAELVFIQNVGPRRPDGGAPPYPCFERLRDGNLSFDGMAAFGEFDAQLKIDGQLESARGMRVSGNYFSLLGIPAGLGRTFTLADDVAAGATEGPVAVLSHNYWTRRFGREPGVLGKVIEVSGQPTRIVGVASADFSGLSPGEDFDISLPMVSLGARRLAQKESWWFWVVGRLKPAVPVEQARAELDRIYQAYMDDIGFNAEARREAFNRIELRPAGKGMNSLRDEASGPLKALMAVVTLVLLIACANVASLLMARAVARRKEFANRVALGASLSRLVRQVLTESFILTSVGALGGLIFARLGSVFIVRSLGNARERLFLELPLNHRVLIFTAGVALFTGLIFALPPALHAARTEPNPTLKEGRSSAHIGGLGKLIVVFQAALCLLLLVGTGLFLRTVHNLKAMDAGFRPDGVLTVRLTPTEALLQQQNLGNLWNEILARAERLPGVRSATLTTLSPLDGSDRGVRINVQGFTAASAEDSEIRMNQVSPGYFQTVGTPILAGRGFTEADHADAPRVALFNEAAARFYFGDRNPIGATFFFPQREGKSPPYEIVGVVKDSRYENLRQADTRLVYLPLKQARDRLTRLILAVRSDVGTTGLTTSVVNEVRAASKDVLLTSVATLEDRVDASLIKERLVAALSVLFGLLALLLACIGLYGVLSHNVVRRTNEIGIRLALGAEEKRVTLSILHEALTWVVSGVLIGLVAAFVTTRWLASLLFGLSPLDPATIGLAVVLLVIVGAAAAWLPARRAGRIDPLVALRHE